MRVPISIRWIYTRGGALQKIRGDKHRPSDSAVATWTVTLSTEKGLLVSYAVGGPSLPQAVNQTEQGTPWAITPGPTAGPRLTWIMICSDSPVLGNIESGLPRLGQALGQFRLSLALSLPISLSLPETTHFSYPSIQHSI